MDTIKIVDEINQDRRRFFGTAAIAVAATQLGMIDPAAAQRMEAKMPAIKPGTNTSFGPLKQIDSGVLNIGYAEAGPANVVVLLHGWRPTRDPVSLSQRTKLTVWRVSNWPRPCENAVSLAMILQ